MNRRNEHREVSSGRASEAATGRLRGSLRREVGDLEVRLEEAQLRSDAFRNAGLDREAAEVLQESRDLVEAFHRRLESALSEAAVEREAERIFAGSEDVLDVLGDSTVPGGVLSRVPAGIGAAVASLAVFAMAIVSLRAPDTRDVQTASDITALPAPSASDDQPAPALRTFSAAVELASRSLNAAELEVLAAAPKPDAVAPLLERRRRILNGMANGIRPLSSTVMAELDELVAQLRTEGVDVDRLMLLERVEQYRIASRDREPRPEDQSQQPAPQPEPQPEPTQEPEPAPEPDPAAEDEDGEEPVFPFGDPDDPDGEEPADGSGEGGGSSASGSDGDTKSDDDGILN